MLSEVPGVDALVGVFDRENIVKAVRGGEYEHLAEAGRDMGAFSLAPPYRRRRTNPATPAATISSVPGTGAGAGLLPTPGLTVIEYRAASGKLGSI